MTIHGHYCLSAKEIKKLMVENEVRLGITVKRPFIPRELWRMLMNMEIEKVVLVCPKCKGTITIAYKDTERKKNIEFVIKQVRTESLEA